MGKDQISMICRHKLVRSICCLILVVRTPFAAADWSAVSRATTYFTSDVGLFTASQRLSRDADPTQPALDTRLTGQGSDGVMETMVQLTDAVESAHGKTSFDVRGDGYIFYDHTQYSNGNVGVQATHVFPTKTSLMVRYYYNPDLFLGNNIERRSGFFTIAPERVSSQIAAMHIGQELFEDVEVSLFSRYGSRRYDHTFQQRNTDFWTVGPHFDWKLMPGVSLGLAYHYERGIAAGRSLPQFSDDVSYVNNFAAADLDLEILEDWTISFSFDYERNHWLSQLSGDDRNGAFEQVYFGEALLKYKIEENISAHCGLQHGSRKMNVESVAVVNTNIGLGLKAEF
jgi:hypothetical protein